ncbi:Rho GTPase [Aspergillus nanangensis]|uniref:Rho GTPase n=1 Tax=Aspergillus nanangensis TaxID=2582783 RepID=A0AAD4CGR4_ASPNN|nr:Rho GTPase [Aspergillus nanangensis]
MAALDCLHRIPEIKVPILVLAGKQDASSTPERMKPIHEASNNSTYVELDPGTHMMAMEQPELVADALVAFRKHVSMDKIRGLWLTVFPHQQEQKGPETCNNPKLMIRADKKTLPNLSYPTNFQKTLQFPMSATNKRVKYATRFHLFAIPDVEIARCVAIGDNGVGKTTLITLYTTGSFCPEVPIVADNYSMNVKVHDEPYELSLWDTHKPEEHDRLRPLSYPGTDILILCFSVVNRSSFENAGRVWLDEMNYYVPGVPWLLIGTQTDRRNGDKDNIQSTASWNSPVTTREGQRMAKKLGARQYIECSSLTQVNVHDVFEQV